MDFQPFDAIFWPQLILDKFDWKVGRSNDAAILLKTRHSRVD
jgi:hypothetical protein